MTHTLGLIKLYIYKPGFDFLISRIFKIITPRFTGNFFFSKKILALLTCKEKYDRIVHFFQSAEFKNLRKGQYKTRYR